MTQPADIRSIDSAPSVAARRAQASMAEFAVETSVSHDHAVQFYENDEFLMATVADYVADGLSNAQPVVLIATLAHREGFIAKLRGKGIDVDAMRRTGRLTLLDARETLATFMVGSMPDSKRFKGSIGGLIDSIIDDATSTVRAYGEMVDVLWKDGNTDGAIRLEELWNELLAAHPLTLLCAYAMGNFYKEAHGQEFRRVCQQHSRVVPTEQYIQTDDSSRLLAISLLQQRARALESEIEHRKELEIRLRDTLAARRGAEDALRESLVRERSARQDAEAANKAKSQFLAAMSHELRTPLNAIAGHVELVEMGVHGELNNAQREALHRVQRSQRHLLALVTNVLNLARIDAGQIEYSCGDVALPTLFSEIAGTVAPLLSAKQLVLDVAPIPSDAMSVRADSEKVYQIVLNLLTNAIKFTPIGGRIALSAARCSDDPDTICICVRDTGIGIPSSKLQRIFEPFVQLGSNSASLRDGIGLGLSISRDLARGMRGELLVDSIVGSGSTFMLRLPRA